MKFSGKVLMAASGKADSTLIVVLHRHLYDSAVAKEKPRYFTHLDSGGNFTFHYLEPGTYAIYALEDDGTKKYQSKAQMFAFADSPIVVGPTSNPILLYAYNDTSGSRPTRKSTAAPAAKKK